MLHRLTFTRMRYLSFRWSSERDSVETTGTLMWIRCRCVWLGRGRVMSWTEWFLSFSGFLYNPSGLMKYEQLLIIGWMINVMRRWSRLLSVDSVCVWLIIFCAVCPEILNLFKVVFCVVFADWCRLSSEDFVCDASTAEKTDSEALKHRGAVVRITAAILHVPVHLWQITDLFSAHKTEMNDWLTPWQLHS